MPWRHAPAPGTRVGTGPDRAGDAAPDRDPGAAGPTAPGSSRSSSPRPGRGSSRCGRTSSTRSRRGASPGGAPVTRTDSADARRPDDRGPGRLHDRPGVRAVPAVGAASGRSGARPGPRSCTTSGSARCGRRGARPSTAARARGGRPRFRDALLDSDVPRLRAYLLWAGTSLDRIVRSTRPVPVAIALVVELPPGWSCSSRACGPAGGAVWGSPCSRCVAALAWGRDRLAVALVQYVGALVLPWSSR